MVEEEDVDCGPMDPLLDCVQYGRFQKRLLLVVGMGLLADATELLLLPFLQVGVKVNLLLVYNMNNYPIKSSVKHSHKI